MNAFSMPTELLLAFQIFDKSFRYLMKFIFNKQLETFENVFKIDG